MNSGALINATNTIDTYVYRGLIELGDISMSSAACVYQSLMGFALVMIANWLTKRYSSERMHCSDRKEDKIMVGNRNGVIRE